LPARSVAPRAASHSVITPLQGYHYRDTFVCCAP